MKRRGAHAGSEERRRRRLKSVRVRASVPVRVDGA